MTGSGLLSADFKTTCYQKAYENALSLQVKYLRRRTVILPLLAPPIPTTILAISLLVWCTVRGNCTIVVDR
jgi:hypothetical protein